MYFICIDCSIREYQFDCSPLCWHNMPAHYALNDAGIFDGGLDNDEHSRLLKIPDNSGTWTISVAVATIHSYIYIYIYIYVFK